jgi:hypothetical protein
VRGEVWVQNWAVWCQCLGSYLMIRVVPSYLMHVGSCYRHGGCLPTISLGNFPLYAFGAAFRTLSTSRTLESLCSRIGRGDVH